MKLRLGLEHISVMVEKSTAAGVIGSGKETDGMFGASG